MEVLGIIALSLVGGSVGGLVAELIMASLRRPTQEGTQIQMPIFKGKPQGKKKPLVRDDVQAWRQENNRKG